MDLVRLGGVDYIRLGKAILEQDQVRLGGLL